MGAASESDPEAISVESVEVSHCADRLLSMVVRLGAGVFVVLCCAGALVWAIEKNDTGTPTFHNRTIVDNFTIYISEYSIGGGNSTITQRTPDAAHSPMTVNVHISGWIQDHDQQKIFHQTDNNTQIFVYFNDSYTATLNDHGVVTGCVHDRDIGYMEYIKRLGLQSLVREHSEIVHRKNHREVLVFHGNPESVNLPGKTQSSFLIQAYAAADTGALLGWDTYYARANDSNLFLVEYWFDDMIPAVPTLDLFPHLPAVCVPTF